MTTPRPASDHSLSNSDAPPMPALRESIAAALSHVPDAAPRAWELWRLEFEGTALPVVVLEVDDLEDDMAVVPVGTDADFADAATVVVAADSNPLGFEVGLWLALEKRVPIFVADRVLGTISTEAQSELSRVRSGLRRGEALGAGSPIVNPHDARTRYRSELEAPLHDLAMDAWSALEEPASASLWTTLQGAGISTSQLRGVGFSSPQLQALRRDKLLLTDGESTALAELLGWSVSEVSRIAPSPPRELLLAPYSRGRRAAVERKGLTHGQPLVAERAQARREVLIANMRVTGPDKSVDWGHALDMWLAAP